MLIMPNDLSSSEKFRRGYVLTKQSDGDYCLELWGASTKHPDNYYFMSKTKNFKIADWVDRDNDAQMETQIFQWLLAIASDMKFPPHALALANFAMENYCDWAKATF